MESFDAMAGVARAAVLVTLTITGYSGRRIDTRTRAEVTNAKGAKSSNAASVYKNLFADCAELKAIAEFTGRVRKEHYRLTLPWSDLGQRLLPGGNLLEYQSAMRRFEDEHDQLVDAFVGKYDVLVAAAAFQLGGLFDRSEYPPSTAIRRRFAINVETDPVPVSGDFRVDIEHTIQTKLVTQFEERMQQKLADAAKDVWDRMHAVLTRMSDRLVVEEDGEKRKFHDTLVSNAMELCDVLDSLNITADPELTLAKNCLLDALTGVTPQALREEESTRLETKRKIDAMLERFSWFSTPHETE